MNLTLCKTIQFSVGNLAFLLLCKLCECHHGDMQRSYSCLSLIVNVIDSWIFLNCSFDCSWFSILDVFLSLFSSAIRVKKIRWVCPTLKEGDGGALMDLYLSYSPWIKSLCVNICLKHMLEFSNTLIIYPSKLWFKLLELFCCDIMNLGISYNNLKLLTL